MKTLSEMEITEALMAAPGWFTEDGKLVRRWEFKDFIEAMKFVNEIAEMAENAEHHPDIDVRYNKVQLALVTHDAGGITKRDASMAKRISGQFPFHVRSM